MTTGKKLAGAAVWTLLLKIFGAMSNFVISVMLTRLLTSDDVGYFFIAQSTAVFIALIARMGMKQPVVRLVSIAVTSRHDDDVGRIVQSAFIIVTTGCVLVMLAVWLGGGYRLFVNIFSAQPLYDLLIVWSCILIIIAFQVPVAEIYRGLDRVPETMLFDGPFGNMLLMCLFLLAVSIGSSIDLRLVLTAMAATYGLSLLTALIRLPASCFQWPRVKLGRAHELFIQGVPVYVFNITTYLANLSGLWVCGAFLTATDAAVYGSVTRLMLLVSLPLFILNMVIQSSIVSLTVQNENDALQRQMRGAATLATFSALLVTTVIVFFSGSILTITFGDIYGQGALALTILAMSSLVAVWAGPCLNFLVLTGNSSTAAKLVFVTTTGSVTLSLVLVGPYGLNGVAIATALGTFMQAVLALLLVQRISGMKTNAYSSRNDLLSFAKSIPPFIRGSF